MIVGVILLVIALKVLADRLSLVKTGEKTVATVIGLEESRSTRKRNGRTRERVTYKPIFKFFTTGNREVIYRGYFSSSHPGAWRVGDQIKIVYNASNPTEAKVLTYAGTFLLPVFLLAVAFLCILISGGYYLAQNIFSRF